MSEAKDSITNLSTNQQKPDTETQKVESLDNIETEQRETADKVKPTPIIFNITTTKTKSRRDKGIYITSLITKKIPISVHLIGRNIKENLEKIIVQEVEGKCIAEGYIKKIQSRL